jgi:hypothetical protein
MSLPNPPDTFDFEELSAWLETVLKLPADVLERAFELGWLETNGNITSITLEACKTFIRPTLGWWTLYRASDIYTRLVCFAYDYVVDSGPMWLNDAIRSIGSYHCSSYGS